MLAKCHQRPSPSSSRVLVSLKHALGLRAPCTINSESSIFREIFEKCRTRAQSCRFSPLDRLGSAICSPKMVSRSNIFYRILQRRFDVCRTAMFPHKDPLANQHTKTAKRTERRIRCYQATILKDFVCLRPTLLMLVHY